MLLFFPTVTNMTILLKLDSATASTGTYTHLFIV